MAVMMTPREKWTDERLDDLSKKVDQGFARMDIRFDRMEERFEKIDERFHALNRTLIGGGLVVIATMIGGSFL